MDYYLAVAKLKLRKGVGRVNRVGKRSVIRVSELEKEAFKENMEEQVE